ncbi:MAG: hypothetical protein COB98_08915 [Flavobacteriaceae bacterium]|nr:MAG: hypothetical protein COB98_08915 [Flavobacteriaceae bacterium]
MCTLSGFSQKSLDGGNLKYRRSSLHRILIQSEDFPKKEIVTNAYYNAPFPEKYNDHSIDVTGLNPELFMPTKIQREQAGLKSSKELRQDDMNEEESKLMIDNFLSKEKIGNKIVGKWFNRQEDGAFDMDLIASRGQYDVTQLDVHIANNSLRGNALISDAGEELINNTFVVVSKMNFVSNEIAAKIVLGTASKVAERIENNLIRTIALKLADKIYTKTSEGYSVWTTSYLYKLNWNDSISTVFYTDLWMDKKNINPARKTAFDTTNLFDFEYVGSDKVRSLVLYSKTGESMEEVVSRATIRNIDRNYVKLQKKYDVFKTKTPLFTGYPITAKIGMKEGLKGGEKFDVLEQQIDSKTGKTIYVIRGRIKVDKKSIPS